MFNVSAGVIAPISTYEPEWTQPARALGSMLPDQPGAEASQLWQIWATKSRALDVWGEPKNASGGAFSTIRPSAMNTTS